MWVCVLYACSVCVHMYVVWVLCMHVVCRVCTCSVHVVWVCVHIGVGVLCVPVVCVYM